jgi:hypothetical protein
MTKKIGKNLQLKKKFNFFGSKTTIYLSLGLLKNFQQKKPSALIIEHPALQNLKFL